jgi:hypothetical protein
MEKEEQNVPVPVLEVYSRPWYICREEDYTLVVSAGCRGRLLETRWRPTGVFFNGWLAAVVVAAGKTDDDDDDAAKRRAGRSKVRGFVRWILDGLLLLKYIL